jgi:tRNA dimethylallyltransferase
MRPVLIAGPTASGKSALALAIAERDNGCAINADALQVYACWRVLTARPDDAALARAPHRLYGHVDCATRYSVGRWLAEVSTVLEEAGAAGRRPVIVGGTGLYLSALTEGLAPIPPIPLEVRRRSQALLDAGRSETLRRALAAGDPETYARLDPSNPMRLQRAWEVLMATGRGLSRWHGEPAPPLIEDYVGVVICPDRSILDDAIRSRLAAMVEEGVLEECRGVVAAGYAPGLPSMRALGAREFFAVLRGTCTIEQAKAAASVATVRFTKRQRTWFRNRMHAWRWLAPEPSASASDLLSEIPRD